VEYELAISLVGLSVSVSIDGALGFGHVFNALVVDGGFGLLTRDGASSFGEVTIETNDPRFEVAGQTASNKDFESTPAESGGDQTGTVALSMSMSTGMQMDETSKTGAAFEEPVSQPETTAADTGESEPREARLALSRKTLARSSTYWLTRRSMTASEPREAGKSWTAVERSDDDRLESNRTTPNGPELLPRTTLSVDEWVQIVRSRRPGPRPHLNPPRP